MPIDSTLLTLLACPQCKGPVGHEPGAEARDEALHCSACALAFPIEEGVPVMVLDAARSVPAGETA